MAHQPDLGITDPYALTEDQLNAAVELFKRSVNVDRQVLGGVTTDIDGFSRRQHGGWHGLARSLSLVELDGKR